MSKSNQLKGAVVRRVVTPPQELIDHERNAGHTRFTGAYEDVYMDTWVISNGESSFVLISGEFGMFPGQLALAKRIEEQYGIPCTNIWFTCNHNHQNMLASDPGEGPSEMGAVRMNGDYVDFVAERAMSALEEAMGRLEPVKLGFGQGESYINVSRDCPSLAGTIQASNYAAPSDKTLVVLCMERLSDGKKLGVFINYAMHNNVLFGHQMNDTYQEIGGDCSGAVCRYVESFIGEDCPVSWGIAAAGDQNPIYMSFNFRAEKGEDGGLAVKVHTLQPEDSFLLMHQMAATQGQDVLSVLNNMTDWRDSLSSASAEKRTTVRGRKNYRSQGLQNLMPGQTVEKIPADPVEFRCRLAVLGDIAFVGINCEAYSRLGSLIKEALPYQKIVFIEMAYGHAGYVPDSETEKLNGFGTMATMVYDTKEMEDAVIGAFKALADEIKA
ncbi:MAG: hypothetical protein J1E06_03985 [Acutalibacter sp.]|nr:hypothetical protein [Acutalibacter sp.]